MSDKAIKRWLIVGLLGLAGVLVLYFRFVAGPPETVRAIERDGRER